MAGCTIERTAPARQMATWVGVKGEGEGEGEG